MTAATTVGVAAVTIGASSAQTPSTSTAGTTTASTSQTASAQTKDTSTQQQSDRTQNGQAPGDPSKGGHQANGKTETVLTGDDLSKATAAAQAKVSGATVVRVETDADGDGVYEVHMKKSDGSMVTVFLDSNFNVTSQTDGMSAKAPQGGPQQNRDAASSSSTTSQSN